MITEISWVGSRVPIRSTVQVHGKMNTGELQKLEVLFKETAIDTARIHTSFTQYALMMLVDKILLLLTLKVSGLDQLENREEVLQREK